MSLKLTYTLSNPRAGKIIVAAQLADIQIICDFAEYKVLEIPVFLAKKSFWQDSFVRPQKDIQLKAIQYYNILPEEHLDCYYRLQISQSKTMARFYITQNWNLLYLVYYNQFLVMNRQHSKKQAEIKKEQIGIKNI